MHFIKSVVYQEAQIPKSFAALLLGIFVFGLFMIGFDQGHLFSIAQGNTAFDAMWMHEFTHDVRHAAGFACH